MRSRSLLASLLILLPWNVWAQFESAVAALNDAVRDTRRGGASILASDVDLKVGNDVLAKGPEAVLSKLRDDRLFSEMTPRLFQLRATRAIADDVVLVDADSVRYGSTIARSSQPVLLVLKRLAAGWRIVSIRVAPQECGTPGALQP